jgi:hypothetical protein
VRNGSRWWACLLAFVCLAVAAPVAVAAGEWNGRGEPNDPGYDAAEHNPALCIHSEEWFLFSFIPRCTPFATDPAGAAGISADRAWARFTPGRPDEVFAYVEGGVNWHNATARAELADRMYLNAGELPLPEHADGGTCAAYDCNGDGIFNVEDYAQDPRIHQPYVNGSLTPEDLIVAFGHCQIVNHRIGPLGCPAGGHFDNDHNGYPNDISGWNFLAGDNDPATGDSAYGHSDDQMERAVAEANNGVGGVGVCPDCMLLPIKAGHEALDTTDRIARSVMFATDSGASVITLLTAELGYSDFTKDALQYAWNKGVVVVGASNDFDSTDHQEGMFWPHEWPGNGLQPNDLSSPTLDLSPFVTSYRERSNLTSFGPHALFSVPNGGGSTSESSPSNAGVALLVGSEGRQAAAQGLIASPLNAGEIKQVVRETVSPIDDPNLGWPGEPGATFNIQYGYGRPNVLAADEAVAQGRIPPVPDIQSPGWYALLDPTRTRSVPIDADIEARRATSFSWRVQYGLGPQPTEAQFHTIATGHVNGQRLAGQIASLDLSQIPASFWQAPLQFTADLSSTEQYDVTIRVQATDSRGLMGEDRRAVAVFHDPSLRPGFPMYVGQGKDSEPVLADLQGTGRLDIVFGDANGYVHALDPDTGRELPGWPAHTGALDLSDLQASPGVRSGLVPSTVYEPIETSPAVGDLFGAGASDVVVSSTSGNVYAFDRFGRLLSGFPRSVGDFAAPASVPPPTAPMTRPPIDGALATPVLAPMPGAGTPLSIVQASEDGHVYAFDARGADVPGWPVNAAVPAADRAGSPYAPINDFKLVATPTLADLFGNDQYELVLRSQQSDYFTPLGSELGAASKVFQLALWPDGNRHAGGAFVPGFPASLQGAFDYYGSAQDALTEGTESASAAPIDGNGADQVMQSTGFLGFEDKLNASGQVETYYPPLSSLVSPLLTALLPAAPGPDFRIPTATTATAPVGFSSTGTIARFGGALAYLAPGVDLASMTGLQRPGIAQRVTNFMRANDTVTGQPLAGFPAPAMGLSFLTAPAVADITGDGRPDVISASDSNNIGAWNEQGQPVPGWPKFTGGWTIWTPAVGDLDGTGHNDVVAITREGWLFVWNTPGQASQNQAYSFHQDNWHTGRYDVDTRPPLVPRAVTVTRARRGGARVCWTAPGDDWGSGTAARYQLRAFASAPTPETFDGGTPLLGAPTPAPGGTRQCARVSTSAAWVGLRAVDAAGLIGMPAAVRLR